MSRLWRKRFELIALAAVISAVAVPQPLVAYGLAFIVLARAAWSFRSNVATLRTARLLAVLAVLAAVWSDGNWALDVAGVLIACFLAVATPVQIALGLSYLESLNLTVRRTRPQRAATPGAIATVMGAAAALLPLAAAAPGGARPAADIVVLVLVLAALAWAAAAVLFNLRRRRRESHPIDDAVVAAVEEHRPKFIVHFAGARHSEYQIQMWLPYFDKLGDPYLVLVRDAHLLEGTAECTDAPIVVAPAQSVLDKLLPETVRACFYSNQAQKNTALVRHGEYLHVQLMHGDSDKAISRSALSLMYDRVFVAGQAGVDRYHRHGVDIPDYKFRRIGRPQLHDIAVGPRERDPGQGPTVLYTPTWTGFTEDVNYSSLVQGGRMVDTLLDRGATVIFRTHPYTRTNAAYEAHAEQIRNRLAADAAASGRAHRWGAAAEQDWSLVDCINAADAAICDISGTASDWLYCGRPFAMTDPKGLGADYLEEFPLAEGAYLLEADAGNIGAVADELLETDSKAATRARVREYYLGDIDPDDLFEVFAEAVRETYAEPVHKVAAAATAA